jgi:hypothetical protein
MHMRNAIKMFGLVSVLALGACGGGEKGDNFGKFVGTWRATAGTITTICPGYTPFTDALTGNAVWSEGVSSDLVSTTALSSCPFMADVTSSTASGVPGQTCTGSDGAGGTSTVTLNGYTFVVSADGRTATENASGQITFIASGASLVCSFSETGSYEKIGK